MFSKSIAEQTTGNLERYIKKNWADSKNGFIKRHILARAGNAILIPFSPITHIVDAILGVAGGVPAIVTGGRFKSINKFTKDHLEASSFIISQPYALFLRTLNPRAKFKAKDNSRSYKTSASGLLTFSIVTNRLGRKAEKYAKSNKFWEKHVVSRLTYTGLALLSVITRVADSIIGLIVAPISLVTFGKVENINFAAYQGLQPLGIVFDIVKYTTKIINPQAEELKERKEKDIIIRG